MANRKHMAVLREGVDAWNLWRDEAPGIKPKLGGARLQGKKLCGFDLRGADLRRADLSGSDLSDANLGGADLLDVCLDGATLISADLQGAFLARANLLSANFQNANIGKANLRYVNAYNVNLSHANLAHADLWFALLGEANLSCTNLHAADLSRTSLFRAVLKGANLTKARLNCAWLDEADLRGSKLEGATFDSASLKRANLSGLNLSGVNLSADLIETNLTNANLSGTTITGMLINTDLRNADLAGCRVYGVSVWDVQLDGANQKDLVITPDGEPRITVDDLEVAQFVYLLLKNAKIRSIIDTIGARAVLILGRFTKERKAVLDAIRTKLRELGFVPMMFDFEKPTQRDFTETVRTLAGMSRFIVADITNPKSSPLELQALMPDYMIPFAPIIHEGEEPFAMFRDLKQKYGGWVLDVLKYDSMDNLIEVFDDAVVKPALEMSKALLLKKAGAIHERHVRDYQKPIALR